MFGKVVSLAAILIGIAVAAVPPNAVTAAPTAGTLTPQQQLVQMRSSLTPEQYRAKKLELKLTPPVSSKPSRPPVRTGGRLDQATCYPSSSDYQTGSCVSDQRTQTSLVNASDPNAGTIDHGWFVFDVSSIPQGSIISSVEFHGYVYDCDYPYWAITRVTKTDPRSDDVSDVYNDLSYWDDDGTYYEYTDYMSGAQWVTVDLGAQACTDLGDRLSAGWFPMGVHDFDDTYYYYIDFHGWNESNVPYIVVTYTPPVSADVGVSMILSPADPFYAFGDTLWMKAEVTNFGSSAQSNVPVHCVLTADGTKVYDDTVTIASLGAFEVDTVDFPVPYAPPATEQTYRDSMYTELSGDGRPENDWQAGNVKVTQWGSLCKAYHNGSFDNAVSWVNYGWWATKYATPSGALINGMNYWTSSFGGADYSQHAQLYLDDAGGVPGTLLYDTAVEMKTAIWTSMYKNHYDIPAQSGITTDSFFVAVYESEWSNGGNYCYFGMCFVNPVTGVDYGKYQSGSWGKFNAYGDMNFGFDFCFSSPLIDAAAVDISYPPAIIDSNTTFKATFAVKNVGLLTRKHVPYQFHIVNDATGDTIIKVSGDAGTVLPGQVVEFTVPDEVTPLPGNYTMTAIAQCPYDLQTQNDTFAAPLFVRYYDVRVQIMSPRIQEVPGLVPVTVKLFNNGNVDAMVPRLDVTIMPAGYGDYRENIAIPAHGSQLVTLNSWVCPAGQTQTAMAWITDPEDMNAGTLNDGLWNDTASVEVRSGIPGWSEMTAMPAPPSGKFIKDGGCMAYDPLNDVIYASKGYKTGDFYAYDVNAGTWETKTGIPLGAEGKGPYKGSVICTDGNGNLYLTKGNNTVGFWGYKESPTAAGTWTQLTNVPTGSSGKKVKQGAGLAWATKAGVGAVYLLKGYRNEFHRYNPVTNAWEQLLDAPIGTANHIKWDAGSWIVTDGDAGNMIYAFKSKYHEFYIYDCETGTWSAPKNAMPIPGSAGNKKAKDGSSAAWYGGKIYAFKGGNTNEFWRYFPLGDTWKKQDDIPLYGASGTRKKVKAGAALAGYPGVGIFGIKGNKSNEFWRYTPYDVVGAQPSRDGITAGATEIGSVSFAIAPNPLSGGFATVRYSLPKAGLATLNVFDVAGRTVLTQTMAAGRTGTASLDLRKLEAGVYLVKVTTEGFSTTQKLVVEH